MNLQKTFSIPLYRAKVRFIFTDDMNSIADRYQVLNQSAGMEAFTLSLGSNIVVAFPLSTSHNTIAHELFHVADMILRDRGMELTCDSCEAWAYLIGLITKEVYKFINMHNYEISLVP